MSYYYSYIYSSLPYQLSCLFVLLPPPVLGIGFKASHRLGKHRTTKLSLQVPLFPYIFKHCSLVFLAFTFSNKFGTILVLISVQKTSYQVGLVVLPVALALEKQILKDHHKLKSSQWCRYCLQKNPKNHIHTLLVSFLAASYCN